MEREFKGINKYPEGKNIYRAVMDFCDENLLYQSRVHALPSFSTSSRQVFCKREDESGFGISGYKKRKYASLIPHLKNQQMEETIVIGTAFSNHVCGILQLLNENKLPYTLWLKQSHQLMARGNWFLTTLLSSPEQIKWISQEKWETVEYDAHVYASQSEHKVFVLPEGGSVKEAAAGAATLSLDLVRNEEDTQMEMAHIFMDAGTGFTAACTAYMLRYLQKSAQLHLVKIGDPKDDYKRILSDASQWIEEITGSKAEPPSIYWYQPVTAKSFGQVNSTLSQFVADFAREEGVLTDPIYSAKLFMTAKEVIIQEKLTGNILIVHSGGGIGLLGHAGRINIR